MQISRRQFLAAGGAVGIGAVRPAYSRSLAGLKIGVTDWNLRLRSKPEALSLAHELGFDDVEVSLGRIPVGGKLPLADTALQLEYLTLIRELKFPISATCLDILHKNYLKSDKLGQKWVADAIPITQALKARVILLPFFGKGALKTTQEMDHVGDILRELAPQAEKAGVILGLEDTISAKDNVRIMKRSRSAAVKVFYDVGNATNNGFDIFKEIAWLGRDRICQFHLKDNPHYLGEGKIDFRRVIDAIADLDFHGCADLETSCPSNSIRRDMKRNLKYVRRLINQERRA